MSGHGDTDTTAEASKVLDALAALSVDLSCHCNVEPHALVLPASKVREACDAIDDAVASLRQILANAAASPHGPATFPTLRPPGDEPER